MFDILLRNGKLLDGTGSPWLREDIGIKDGRIAEMGRISARRAKMELDCSDQVISPGFIDTHTHSDLTRLLNPAGESYIFQGVTTEVVGNCGMSAAPLIGAAREPVERFLAKYNYAVGWFDFEGYFTKVNEAGNTVNAVSLVGHNTVRAAVMGYEARAATTQEVNRMAEYVRAAMRAGVVGFSTGLVYSPGNNADISEIVHLARTASKFGGIYTTHIRGEDVNLLPAVDEALEIGREADIPLHLSHHPCKFPATGMSRVTLQKVEAERDAGRDITCDLHPYDTGASFLVQLLPPSCLAEGFDRLPSLLRQVDFRERVRQGILTADNLVAHVQLIRAGRWDDLKIEYSVSNPAIIGKSIKEIAVERKADPFEALLDVMAEEGSAITDALMFGRVYDEQDVRRVMRHETSMFGSDGYSLANEGPLATLRFHPRSYGTFPRVLGHYVRREGLLGLSDAIRKMTSFPARRFGLYDRGILRPSLAADIVAFNPDEVTDRATESSPKLLPTGITHVIVNGQITVQDGKLTNGRAGQVLRPLLRSRN